MKTPVALALGSVAAQAAAAPAVGSDWMSASEQARCQAIASPRRRAQFIAGRWLLRQLLARTAGGLPADWLLLAEADSPPRVERAPLAFTGCLGLAHSGDGVLCAVAPGALGVDIEAVDARRRDVEAWSEFALSPRERSHVLAADGDPEPPSARLLMHWTMKEAWLKAYGRGLAFEGLCRIEALPAEAGAGNALLCCTGGFTLAVATPQAVPVIHGEQAGLRWQAWRIEEIAPGSTDRV